MKSTFLLLNHIKWSVSILGESAILLTLPTPLPHKLAKIHSTVFLLEQANIPTITEVVPAYESLAIFFDVFQTNLAQLLKQLQELPPQIQQINTNKTIHKIPIAYDLGLDWEFVERATNFSKIEIIQKHLAPTYQVAMMGFIPGFVYLSGLDAALSCPRKENPRTKLPKGSVGIGGNQTGIYSLSSPGGWQIIGQTPHSFFKENATPPNILNVGDSVKFYRIEKN